MPDLANYPVPYLFGRVSYPPNTTLRPDGDTIHLRDPVILLNGQVFPPQNGKLSVFVTGATKPRTINVKGKPGSTFVPVRFEGVDAPEEHYRATPFTLKMKGKVASFPFDPAVTHEERSQPMWSAGMNYAVAALEAAGWALVLLDREVTDRYGRVLGYVYASDANGGRGPFISLELLKRGLAFPFLFESAGSFIPMFLAAAAAARKKKLGVWRHYHHRPLSFPQTYPVPPNYLDPEPPAQFNGKLNLPVIFRRIVDAHQLKGLSSKLGFQKYDAMDYPSGDLVTGDKYYQIPIERLIWAPHRFS